MFSNRSDESSDRVINDMTLLLNAALIMVIFILIMFIGEKSDDGEVKQQGNLVFEIYWDDGLESDVDMWVQPPNHTPVGYSNMGSKYLNLLRDDLGNESDKDISGRNMEMMVSRGLVEGEWTANVYLFGLDGEKPPIDVRMVVSMKSSPYADVQQLFAIDTQLHHAGQEKTMVRFEIRDKELVEGSVHHTFKPIASVSSMFP